MFGSLQIGSVCELYLELVIVLHVSVVYAVWYWNVPKVFLEVMYVIVGLVHQYI